jgi:hypothetical protein
MLAEICRDFESIYVGFHRQEYSFDTIRNMDKSSLRKLMSDIGMNRLEFDGKDHYYIYRTQVSITDKDLQTMTDDDMWTWWGTVIHEYKCQEVEIKQGVYHRKHQKRYRWEF